MRYILICLIMGLAAFNHGAVASNSELPGADEYEKYVDGYGLRPSENVAPTVEDCMKDPSLFDCFVRGSGARVFDIPTTEECEQAVEGYYSLGNPFDEQIIDLGSVTTNEKFETKCDDLRTLPWGGGTVCIGKDGQPLWFGDHMGNPDNGSFWFSRKKH